VPTAPIYGDRELLVQALVNLIENALRHTPERSTITVSVVSIGGAPELAVSDDGPGVPEAERTRILNRFYRSDASRTTPGSGLGLSLVAAVAELHQAALYVEDAMPGLRVRLQFLEMGDEPGARSIRRAPHG
jgi:signal transduction histidine kinase